MKKLITFTAIAVISTSVFAITPEEKIAQEKENLKMLEDLGLPLPGSGIKLVPRSLLGLSEEQIKQGDKEAAEFRENGFVNKYINRPRELLSIKPSMLKEEIKNDDRDSYTGLSSDVSKIKLAFQAPSLKSNTLLRASAGEEIKFLAATPQGGFHKEIGGWSGVTQYFSHSDIGTCAYSVMNVKSSNTAVQLAQEDVTYTVNNKATVLYSVEGNENSGFLYSLKWYDDVNFHELQCANLKYSSQINDNVIELAKKIDKS